MRKNLVLLAFQSLDQLHARLQLPEGASNNRSLEISDDYTGNIASILGTVSCLSLLPLDLFLKTCAATYTIPGLSVAKT